MQIITYISKKITMKYFITTFFALLTIIVSAQNGEAAYNLAKSLYEKKDYKGALKAINKAIATDSTKSNYFRELSDIQFKLALYNESYLSVEKAVSLSPGNAECYIDRGNLLLSFREYNAAIRDFNTALELATTDSIKVSALINLSSAKSSKRDFEGAYKDLIVAYQLDSTNLGVLNNLGMVCDEVGRKNETLIYLLKIVAIDSQYVPAIMNIGFKYQLEGNHKEAITYFDKALQYSPNEALCFSNRSYSKLQLGDTKGAMQDIEKAIKLYPGNSYAYRNRALINIKLEKYDAACADLKEAAAKGFLVSYGKEVTELQRKYCR